MNKFSLYVLLILIYLGISKSFSPSERKTFYILNEKVFPNIFLDSPVTVILKEAFSVGFIIKTYYHKYLIVHAFKPPEEIIVRTSKEFWDNNQKNLGMSLFRRGEKDNEYSNIAMPPGSLFVGDPAYGTWELTGYGGKIWSFHRTYKNFPQTFGWGEFRPDLNFYERMKIHISDRSTFYGLNNEFGTDGVVSKDYHVENFDMKNDKINIKDVLKSYLKINARGNTNE